MKEKLIDCLRCGSNACSEMSDGNITIWQCLGCGFTTNSFLTKKYSKKYKEILPELYKALEFKDKNNLHWYPTSVVMDDKSMIFAEGNSITNWKWAAVKSRELTEEEKPKFKGETHIADMTTKKEFDERDFIEALEYVGYFNLLKK